MWKDENNQSWDVCCDVDCCSRWANYCPGVCVSDAQPTEMERDVWNQVNSVLQDSESILLGLQAYKGAGQEIRDVRNNAGAGCWRSPRLLMVDVRLTCSSVCFVLFQAIQNPNDFMQQERAWNSVCPLVIKLKKFYSFSLRLGGITVLK